ncbi:hypothetical protein JXB28_06500, partial [Candidatus Woesearchaeota archaeon]|nr:hypothetical protein [Candidatus Woesearchaeota archaeon]
FVMMVSMPAIVSAATINAASCSSADVQAAVNSAVDGDIISIPTGACTWSNNVTIPNTKGLTLSGQGPGNTVISGPASPKFILNVRSGYYAELNNMEFRGPGRCIEVAGSGTNVFRITRLKFDNVSFAIHTAGLVYGVVDHCEFIGPSPYPVVGTGDGNAGVDSWYAQLDLGGPTAVYLEDSTINIYNPITGVGMSDSNDGGRIVIRNNNITNHWWGMHDACPNFRMGGRKFEIYNNNWYFTSSIWTSSYHRGGTGVVFNNTFRSAGVINAGTPLRLNRAFYRGISMSCQFLWETDCDSIDEMMCSDGNGKVWPLPCTTDADCSRHGGHCDTVVDEPGVGYPCRSQTGTDTGRVNHPIVGWNNYFCQTGLYCNPTTLAPMRVNDDAYQYVREERDFIDDTTCSDGVDNDEDGLIDMDDPTCSTWWADTQKKDYTPYTYPHPLAGGSIPETIPGDLNNDRIVDIADLVIVVGDFGKEEGFIDEDSDTNADGTVDVADLVFVARRYTG